MNTVTTKPKPTEPAGYVVWHREQRPRARWKKCLTTTDRATAIAAVNSRGDWWVAEVFDPELLKVGITADHAKQPGLFE